MLSQEIAPLRLAVWNGLLDAERYVRYYGALAERYRRQHQIPRYIMAVAAVVGAVPIFFEEQFPLGVTAGAILLILAAVAWDLLSDHGRKAAILDAISVECGEYENQLRDLWISIEQGLAQGKPLDPTSIRADLSMIEAAIDRVTDRSSLAGVATDNRLNEKMMGEANEVLTARFTIGGTH